MRVHYSEVTEMDSPQLRKMTKLWVAWPFRNQSCGGCSWEIPNLKNSKESGLREYLRAFLFWRGVESRPRQGKWWGQRHTASEGQNWGWNQGALFPTTFPPCPLNRCFFQSAQEGLGQSLDLRFKHRVQKEKKINNTPGPPPDLSHRSRKSSKQRTDKNKLREGSRDVRKGRPCN